MISRLTSNIRRMSSNARPLHDAIKTKLTHKLHPTHLHIHDHSREHAEHAAMRNQGYVETHFDILVVSPVFDGVSAVNRHRMVYGELKEEFGQGLHAVNIKARTPEEYDRDTIVKE